MSIWVLLLLWDFVFYVFIHWNKNISIYNKHDASICNCRYIDWPVLKYIKINITVEYFTFIWSITDYCSYNLKSELGLLCVDIVYLNRRFGIFV